GRSGVRRRSHFLAVRTRRLLRALAKVDTSPELCHVPCRSCRLGWAWTRATRSARSTTRPWRITARARMRGIRRTLRSMAARFTRRRWFGPWLRGSHISPVPTWWATRRRTTSRTRDSSRYFPNGALPLHKGRFARSRASECCSNPQGACHPIELPAPSAGRMHAKVYEMRGYLFQRL
ncbi:unnamed protein product, partial [Effrenium voratum]